MPSITEQQLRAILPSCQNPASWVPHIEVGFDRYGIESSQRRAAFLAQVGHESNQFNRLEENLNYSAPRLREVFARYFPDDATARRYERQRERIANRVYADRLGNGPEDSGDGWKYRGRGLIQVTGKSNYRDAGTELGLPLVDRPELLQDPANAVMSACWFWKSRGLNALADHAPGANDDTDFRKITKAINGGLAGLEERRQIWLRARQALGI